MKRSTKWFLALFVIASLMAASVVAVGFLTTDPVVIADGSVLQLDLQGAWPEYDASPPINSLFGVRVVTLHDLIGVIDAAADDDRIRALHVRVGLLHVGWGKATELRDALMRFRESGKPLHAYVEYGNDGTYFVASAADEIRMPHTGLLWMDGIRAEVPFYAGTLEKIGVTADLEQIAEYKNAADA